MRGLEMPTNENNVLKLCHRKGTGYKQSTEGKKMSFVSNSSRILFFSFFEKSKGSRNEKSFIPGNLFSCTVDFHLENNDWAPLPWSFFTHCHKNRSHSYIISLLMQTLDRKLVMPKSKELLIQDSNLWKIFLPL